MDYRSKDPRTQKLSKKEIRFPTGTNKNYPQETLEETRNRKMLEETGLRVLHSRHLGRQTWPDHIKNALLVDYADCAGRLRQGQLISGDKVMSRPYWMPAKKLASRIANTHKWAFEAAYQALTSAGK